MISVIVPVYNVEQYIDRCIKSIINQTYKEIEIILVDDGSTDTSGRKCDQWQREDSRIRVIHKENGGLSDARNAGIDIASGDYIGFVDSDDWIEYDMYESLVVAIEEYQAEVAVTGINRVYDNGYNSDQFIHKEIECFTGREIVKKYLSQNSFSTAAWDKLYKKELFLTRRFPVGKLYEDAPVIYDILKEIDKIVVVGKAQYHYFQRSNSICGQSFSKKKMDHYEFSRSIMEDVKKNYSDFESEADVFWGCKVCEILYSLYESENYKEYPSEAKLLKTCLREVWKEVICSKTVSKIIKCKIILSVLGLEKIYILIRNMRVRKGR